MNLPIKDSFSLQPYKEFVMLVLSTVISDCFSKLKIILVYAPPKCVIYFANTFHSFVSQVMIKAYFLK